MISKIKNLIRSQSFSPGFLGIFFNPFYIARKNLHNAIAEYAETLNGDLLDVGCGTKPYQDLFSVKKYIGLDIDSTHTKNLGVADYLYDGKKFPFTDASFDVVLCNQVFEHVFNPDEFLAEIVRVLKINGTLLLTVPFVWDEHEQPFDYARYTTFALQDLLGRHGMKITQHKKLGADISVIFQLTNAYLVKVTGKWSKYPKLLMTITVMFSFNFLGIILSHVFPKNQDLLHCFKRFFLLLEYARIMDLQKFWMIDSDVILLKNLLEYANEISAGDYVASLSWQNQTDSSMSWSISPHISYWTIDALDDFVNFMIDLFLPKNISKLHQKYYFHLERKIPGGICDMTALYLWVKKGVKVYNNASSINLKPALFDHNINLSSNYSQDEFKMTPFLGIKKIRWSFKDRAFYAFHKNGGRINVVALHFQGAAKKYISRFIYFKCVSLWLCIDFIPRIIYRKLRQAWNVLWKI